MPKPLIGTTFTCSDRTHCSARKTLMLAAQKTFQTIPLRAYRKTLKNITPPYKIHISLVSPSTIKRLNSRYRNKERSTDVLAFSRGTSVEPKTTSDIGDVILCPEVARTHSRHAGITLRSELQRLTVHGILHLFGFDHEKDQGSAKKMFRLQEKILSSLHKLTP